MIDHRINLTAQVPSVKSAIDIYNNTLLTNEKLKASKQQRQHSDELLPLQKTLLGERAQQAQANTGLLGTQNEVSQGKLEDIEKNRKIANLAEYMQTDLAPVLQGGNVQEITGSIITAAQNGILDEDDGERLLQQVNSGDMQGVQRSIEAATGYAKQRGLLGGGGSTKSYAPITDPNTGQMSIPTYNAQTGEVELKPIEGAIAQTPQQRIDNEVSQTQRKERIKKTEARTSEIKKELSTRNRSAARSVRTIRQALTLSQNASQGLSGAAKLQLSRLIPGIDSSDEGALDSVLKQLALEQLQNFKGPTTDFEFGVTESIVGGLGQSKESNIARLKSLDRNNWFMNREFAQFKKHMRSGADPDEFRFNFNEEITTRKGTFTLQDIQDTAVHETLSIEEVLEKLNNASN